MLPMLTVALTVSKAMRPVCAVMLPTLPAAVVPSTPVLLPAGAVVTVTTVAPAVVLPLTVRLAEPANVLIAKFWATAWF